MTDRLDLVPADGKRRGALPRRRRALRWSAAAIAASAIAVGAVFGARLNRDPTLVDTPLIGSVASDRSLPYLEQNGSLSLKDLRGQVVVVNFWASWCVACRKEHPELLAAASAYRAAGVQFVGVVYQDSASNAVGFLDEMGRSKGYVNLTDPGSRLAIDFGVFGVPETFILDRKGRIAAKITGASSFPLLAGVLNEVTAGRRPVPSKTVGPVQRGPGE